MNPLSSFAKKLHAQLQTTQHITLIAHKSPDGDAIGSLEGLRHLLNTNYAHLEVSVCVPEEIYPTDPRLIWLLGDHVTEIPAYSTDIIVLDCSTLNRVALPSSVFLDKNLLCIDHHEIVPDSLPGYIEPQAASTTIILTDLAQELGWTMSPVAATALLTGVYTDTGGFIHKNTNAKAFETASLLMQKGANQGQITGEIFGNYTLSFLHALGQGLLSIIVYDHVGCLFLPEMPEFGLKNHIVGYMSGLQDVDIACVLLQKGHEIRASLRTRRDDIDVNLVAKKFDGGGHKKAAGFELKGTIQDGQLNWNNTIYTARDFIDLLRR